MDGWTDGWERTKKLSCLSQRITNEQVIIFIKNDFKNLPGTHTGHLLPSLPPPPPTSAMINILHLSHV